MTDRQRVDLETVTRGGGGLSPGLRRFVQPFDPAKHVLWQCQADEQLLRASQQAQPQGGGRDRAGGATAAGRRRASGSGRRCRRAC